MREVIQLDLDKLDTRSGLAGLFALTTSLVAAAVLGPEWIAAGIAALFVVAVLNMASNTNGIAQ